MGQDKEHVLYLFGAGASANAVPVVDKLSHDMKKVARKLEKWYKVQVSQEGAYRKYQKASP